MTGEPALIPRPAQRHDVSGTTTWADGMAISAPSGDELASEARWFRHLLERATGWNVQLSQAESAELVLRLAPDLSHLEGYRLNVSSGGVIVEGGAPAGVFYGLQTLRQLLPHVLWREAPVVRPHGDVEIAGTEISDEPRFEWRGIHLDVGRHFMPKRFLFRLVDLISLHKFNVLHLHLTEDQGWRVEIEKYPRLTSVGAWRRESMAGHAREKRFDGKPHGGFYTKDDLRELVSYAAERHVTVMPEIDMPGHMLAAIAAYPELGNASETLEVSTEWGISHHVLNLEDTTLQFCTDVLDEIAGLFPSLWVHVGGDECPTVEWESSERARLIMQEEGLEEPRQLQGWFTERIAAHLAGLSRTLVGWDEILEGGAPAGAIVMSWRGEEGGLEAAAKGHDVVMTPEQWVYLDWANSDDPAEPLAIRSATPIERVYAYEPVPAAMPDEQSHHVLGAQCNLWTEYVPTPEHAEYMYFPRICAFSEVVWSSKTTDRHFAEFSGRLKEHLARLEALGVNYRPLPGPTPGQASRWAAGPGRG